MSIELAEFADKRIIICGGSRCSKTTKALEWGSALNIEVFHTDSLIETLEWKQVSAAVVQWFSRPGPWIIEGVAGSRAIRKWLDQIDRPTTDNRPCDILIRLNEPVCDLTQGQAHMNKAERAYWSDISRAVHSWPGMLLYWPEDIAELLAFTEHKRSDS